jgi:uncharacterized protein (TIGR03437 family)
MHSSYAVLVLLLTAQIAASQVCRLSVAGLNRNRRVLGDVNMECPHPLHDAPFGNWGVTSNFGGKINGHQFDGWCQDKRVCDNRGNCFSACGDRWYEWNTCTDHPDFRAPNCTLYNARDCTEQQTNQDVNVMSTRSVDVSVRCPIDTDGDGRFDRGGCADVTSYNPGENFMSLYELDPLSTDELVQTLYFPETPVRMNCNVLGCGATGSDWVEPRAYADPVSPQRVYTQMAAVVNFGNFVDSARACPAVPPILRTVSAASFVAPGAAPESIVSAFGFSLAGQTAQAPPRTAPLELAGTRVGIMDSSGIEQSAPLFYVSPEQINYLVPRTAQPGLGIVRVYRATELRATGSIQIDRVAPGIFTANSSGTGAPAALITRVLLDGTVSVENAFECPASGACAPRLLTFSSPIEPLYLTLFATGIRGRSGPVTVRVADQAVDVLYAGPQNEYPGLDQVNVRLPATLAGRDVAELVMTVDGRPATPVLLRFR